MHRFRDNELVLQTGSDVMVISPLGGAVRSFRWRILKGWPQVSIHDLLTCFVYLQPHRSYLTFCIWLGFPYWRRNFGGFWGKWPPKSENIGKHLLRGHFLTSNRVFWAIMRENRFTGIGCTRVNEYKKKKKARDPYISPPRGGATARTIFTKLGRVGETRDVINLAKFQINWFKIVSLVRGWILPF